MLKVECESCKAPYQVDERRVPPTGLKMRCPKCGHTFLVTDPGKGAPPAAAGPGGKAPPARPALVGGGKATMVGVGIVSPLAAPPAGGGLPDLGDLPAAKPAPPKGAPPPRAAAPAASAAPRKVTPAAPAAPAPLPGLDDLDLPALAGDVGLPAAVPRAPARPAPQVGGFNLEMDLPAVAPANLPAPKMRAPEPPPPAASGFGSIDLPSPRNAMADLPMVQNDLPIVGGNLPMVSKQGHLPVPKGATPPKPIGGGGFGEIDLPIVQNNLPAPLGLQAQMPTAVSDDRLLPKQKDASPIAFGELDLPLVGTPPAPSAPPPMPSAPPAPPAAADGGGFGELDLPPDPRDMPPAPSGGGGASPGGMAFGEVDLGGDTGGGQVMGPPPAASAGAPAFQEASLEAAAPASPGGLRARPGSSIERPRSKAPLIVGAAVALLVVGGAALQFTPLGAFGYMALSDKMHAGDYVKQAADQAAAARKKVALDTFGSALQAADDLADARRRAVRSRPLAAYAAFVEFANEVRFGADSGRLGRAKTFIADVPPDMQFPYLAAALAAQDAASGDLDKAKSGLDAAVSNETSTDPIQQDMAALRGEIAIQQKDAATAIQAFTLAAKAGPTPRTQFGLARAHFLNKSLTKAKEAVDATLKESPTHAGALTLRAQLAWEIDRDDVGAMKDLAVVLDDKARKTEGSAEVSAAYAAKGWILLARDRAGEARAAFDEAVKVESRNVSALVGQGEVLYADGRFTEALTRFDEAVKKEPTSILAIIGSAKTKISLERLADAKSQLAAARQKAPKDMSLALWLAKTEEALGNKQVAETLYSSAMDLADPQNPDAIQGYAAYASFLASQGRASEAQAKLDQARTKLPDSAALQRAFGEVAAAQGQFDQALSYFDAALAKNPNDLGTRFRLAVTYRKMRRLDQAAAEFDKVAAIDKEYPGIALERGLLFEESGDVRKALEQFQSAHEKAPNDADLMLRVGAAYVSIGDVEKAFPLLNKVKDLRPNSAEANHFIGRAYLKQGGVEAATAMRYLKRAVELDPNRAEYHLYVAWAANDAVPAQLGLARVHVDRALQLDKLLADAYWQRGVLERREGAVKDAIKDLKHALELKPGRHEAHAALAECYEDTNDIPAAMAEWAKAIAGDDKQATWRARYGRLLLDKGNTAEAAKHLTFAVQSGKSAQPRPGWLGAAAFEAGEALKKLSQKDQAIEHYCLFLELAPPTSPDRRDALKGLKDLGGSCER